MPPHARPGDILVRFLKSDLTLVLSPSNNYKNYKKKSSSSTFSSKASLVGHAILAPLEVRQPQSLGNSGENISINMDLRLLQFLTR